MSKDKIKKFLLNPWTISIGTAIFTIVITMIVDAVKEKPILSTIGNVFVVIWNAILSFLTFDLKVWWVLLGIVVIVLGFIIFVKILDYKQSQESEPKFLQYTQDTLLGWKWEWRWRLNTWNQYELSNLHPICSKCDTPLVPTQVGYCNKAKCPRCNSIVQIDYPDETAVKVLIYDNVKRMESELNQENK